MKKMKFVLLGIILWQFSGTAQATKVDDIPQSEAKSISNGNGANVGGDANLVSGNGHGAGGPGDGQGPGNGAGQGIGNAFGNEKSSSDQVNTDDSNVASPAPEPEVMILLAAGGLLGAFWLSRKYLISSHRA
jgi:hypothetical protein